MAYKFQKGNAKLAGTLQQVGGIVTTGIDAATAANAVDSFVDKDIPINRSALTNGQIAIGDGSGTAQSRAVSGDITISNTGVTAIAAGVIVNADISGSAAIAFDKLASLPSTQILVGNGSNEPAAVAMSGDVSISNAGVTAIAAGVIVNADVNGSAAISLTKIDTNVDMAGNFTIGNQPGDTCTIGGHLTVTGDLIVSGDTVTTNVSTLSIEDPLIALGTGNGADSVDLGFYAKYTDGGVKYAGLFRDASDSDKWKLFARTGNSDEVPSTTVNTSAGYAGGTLVATLEGSSTSCTGNAATATALASARTIGGTSFDGTANIAVNLAATATALANARTIGGVSFDGTANINLPGVNAAGNQDTTGNAGTFTCTDNENENLECPLVFVDGATGAQGAETDGDLTYNPGLNGGTLTSPKFAGALTGNVTGTASSATILAVSRNIGGVAFNGSANIDLPGVNQPGNQNTSGVAATATALASARTIGGVSFDGSANIVPNTVTVVDNESTAAENTVWFGGADGGGATQPQSDGHLTYNPGLNGGTLTAVKFKGDGSALTNLPAGTSAINFAISDTLSFQKMKSLPKVIAADGQAEPSWDLSSYTIDTDSDLDYYMYSDSHANNDTINLTAKSGQNGRLLIFKNGHASNVLRVDANGSETIEGANAAIDIEAGGSVTLMCIESIGWVIH